MESNHPPGDRNDRGWYNATVKRRVARDGKGPKIIRSGPLSRRRFLGLGSAVLTVPLLSRLSASAAGRSLPPDRDLSFFNTHTEESIAVEYCRSGCLVGPALAEINHVLRDHRTGEHKEIDVRLLDLHYSHSQSLATGVPFHVLSGYRSPRTNEYLRLKGGGVAANSLHLLGQAVDIRVPGVKLRDLYRTAKEMRCGGVGFYPGSDFVHVDVGRVRCW